MNGLERMALAFSDAKHRGEAVLIPFLTAGHPDFKTTERLILALSEAGADLVEIGIPFSDPLADGPVIQKSSQTALDNGFTLDQTFEMVDRLRKRIGIPILFMSYCNPIYSQGLDPFLRQCTETGVDGLIVPDLTLEESEDLRSKTLRKNLALIQLVAPTSPPKRVEAITQASTGFVYAVSLKGVTGARKSLPSDVIPFLNRVKKVSPQPVSLGFGISNPEQVRSVAKIADGVVVGSAFVKIIDRYGRLSPLPVVNLARRLKRATRR